VRTYKTSPVNGTTMLISIDKHYASHLCSRRRKRLFRRTWAGEMMRLGVRIIVGLLLALAPAAAVCAQEPFHKGKQIRLIISAGVSGGYVEYARLLAANIGDHLAGHPDFT